jgi:hypothetical protein
VWHLEPSLHGSADRSDLVCSSYTPRSHRIFVSKVVGASDVRILDISIMLISLLLTGMDSTQLSSWDDYSLDLTLFVGSRCCLAEVFPASVDAPILGVTTCGADAKFGVLPLCWKSLGVAVEVTTGSRRIPMCDSRVW